MRSLERSRCLNQRGLRECINTEAHPWEGLSNLEQVIEPPNVWTVWGRGGISLWGGGLFMALRGSECCRYLLWLLYVVED